ncbi:acyloxyacyl hydrolase [Starkeya koreensis]|uniref:Acyloxyacyl hydrolase n=1 Tax=Ancylobacter koreensis TaxID=266121 RepID=A0ABT0DLL5_9HYPH|nr:acyloxyacyl hydrolase [Ancylobacter koreensis]MCK0208160.1 acyloxyacyl hydrolase [Ancylobacter koreensis]
MALALLGAGLFAAEARAADAADDMDASDLLARAPKIDEPSGWYLRGDIGYVVNQTPDISQLDFLPAASGGALADAWLIGAGIGLRLNDLVRVDVTADYRTRADYTSPGLTADFNATTLLANVYVDLGTWHGFTPYVGAGAGASYVSVTDIEVLGTDIGRSDGWSVAWALMAGVAVAVNANWQIDVGYRYLQLSDAGAKQADFEQSAHEARLGVRYLFD